MNTPLRPAIRAGAREIHVLALEPKIEKLEANCIPNRADTLNRFLFVAVANLVRKDIENVRDVNARVAIAEKIKPLIVELGKEPALKDWRENGDMKVQSAVGKPTVSSRALRSGTGSPCTGIFRGNRWAESLVS